MTSATYLVCLMALLPIIFSLPTPPITTDPAIKIQVTAKGLEKIGEYLTKYMSHYARDISSDKHTYKGYFTVDKVGSVDITTIPSDHAAESYEGFKTVERRERTKRDTTEGPIKMYYEDTEFLTGKKIGGLQLVTKDVEYKFNVTRGEHHYYIQRTGGACKTRVYIGQEDGHIKLARVAMESEGGEFEVMKDGQVITSAEEKHYMHEKLVECVIREFVEKFATFEEEYPNVVGVDKLVFDHRFTEDPLFTTEGIELSLVGKFVYDEEHLYTKRTCETLQQYLTLAKMFKTTEHHTMDGTTYTETFDVIDTEDTPHTTALAAEGTEEEETARKAKTAFRVTLSEDLFNSLADVMVKSEMMDITLPKEVIQQLMAVYMSMVPSTKDYSSLIPEDMQSLGMQLKALPEGKKHVKFLEGGMEKTSAMEMSYNGKTAEYHMDVAAKMLFRHGKFARDVEKFTIVKTAEEGYPKMLTKEMLETCIEKHMENSQFILDGISEYVTEFAFHEGAVTLGLECMDH